MVDYRNTDEKNYFGSDLNKFVNNECSKEMTVINIDMLQYKRSKRILRIIESKHTYEKLPKSQQETLDIISYVFRFINKWLKLKYVFECYIITGDPPYDTAEIKDLVNQRCVKLNNRDFINFLEFKSTYQRNNHASHLP